MRLTVEPDAERLMRRPPLVAKLDLRMLMRNALEVAFAELNIVTDALKPKTSTSVKLSMTVLVVPAVMSASVTNTEAFVTSRTQVDAFPSMSAPASNVMLESRPGVKKRTSVRSHEPAVTVTEAPLGIMTIPPPPAACSSA